MVEIKEELLVKLTAMSRNKITKLNRRFGEQGNCRNMSTFCQKYIDTLIQSVIHQTGCPKKLKYNE